MLTDLVFNVPDVFTGLERAFMNWNRVGGRFGPSRIFKLVFLEIRARFAVSFEKILEWDFERVIMNHGTIVEQDGKNLIRAAFKDYL